MNGYMPQVVESLREFYSNDTFGTIKHLVLSAIALMALP